MPKNVRTLTLGTDNTKHNHNGVHYPNDKPKIVVIWIIKETLPRTCQDLPRPAKTHASLWKNI